MLKLDRMEISGFKSFSDRTEVRFPHGITAVVGPNGCGKSNIGDALNWVLGEQSPRMLRGRQMADVIFNGSRSRKPLGMAEVSLHLAGAEGLPYADHGRVALTRRLFRNGESDYLINGSRARLKDIQEILREARIGTKTYATIEQGKVEQVLNARPRDRRMIIEDAAGIAGYKHKRRLTELKLEATEANLLRVNDVIVEVRRQIGSLKRQAAKARRYQRLREELRDKELLRYGLRARTLDEALAAARAAEGLARDAESEAAAGLGRAEVEALERRQALDAANRAYAEAAERLHKLELEIDREEGLIATSRQRRAEAEETSRQRAAEGGELDRRLAEVRARIADHGSRLRAGRDELARFTASLSDHQVEVDEGEAAIASRRDEIEAQRRQQFRALHELAELRNRRRSTEEALERNAQQRSRLQAERASAHEDRERLAGESTVLGREFEELTGRCSVLHEGIRATEQALSDARRLSLAETEALATAREREQSVAARLRTLEDLDTRFAGSSDGVRTLLGSGAAAGVRTAGVVADFVEARTDIESVAERYLAAILPTVILEDDGDVMRATRLLRQRGAGRTSFISRSQPAGGLAVGTTPNGHPLAPAEVLGDRRVLGRLRERLELKASANGALADRIGDALLVDSLESALELHRYWPGADYLTPEGDIVYASGVIAVGGRPSGDQGLLAHKRRVHEAREELAEAASDCELLAQRVERSRGDVTRLEVSLPEQRAEFEETSRRRVEAEHRTRRSTEEHERTARRSKVLEDELSNLVEEAERLRQSLQEALVALADAEAAASELQTAIDQQGATLLQDERRVKQVAERVAALRADLAASQQRFESLETEQRGLDESLGDLESRATHAAEAARRESARAVEAAALIEKTEASLTAHLEERGRFAAEAASHEQEIAARREQLAQLEEAQRSARADLDRLRETTGQAALVRTRSEESRRHLDDLCNQELGLRAADALQTAGERLDGLDASLLDGEVADLRERLSALGPVNLTAIDEFADLEQRDAFLTAQKDDLDHAMSSLRETIRRINRQSRERFVEAFEKIRASYQEIFKLLFNGGRADLHLEEGDDIDVLEAGVEIMAQPPGKRLTNVQLLSGGEKTMSAIALLFAVFRYSPSPFCLLDEVDAALDDANVGRFARMVREYAHNTQFIIITHNKLSMEAANLMYGVTMEEPGVSRVISLQLQEA